MYIVSTTYVVDPSVHGRWYEFFTQKFIPTLQPRRVVFTRVLSEQSDGHYTYSLQIDAEDIADYQTIEGELIGECAEFCTELFQDKVLHFTTLLKKIEL